MRTTQTFSILFWVYAKRAQNNQSNIYVRITVNGKKVNISLKRKVNLDSWNAKAQKVRGKGKEARELNLYLDEIKAEIIQSFRDLKSEGKVITAELIKARYLGEDKKHFFLSDIFEYHNQNMAHKLAKCTVGHYKTTQKYVSAYLEEKYKVSNIQLQNLDYAFVLGFESFLRSYRSRAFQGTIGNNAAMKHIQRLRKMITLAYNMEWIPRDPFINFKMKIEKKEREFLSKEELQRIEELTSPIERLVAVKDLFIFSCYTGMSYVDIMKLTREDIVVGIDGNRWIMTKRKKTGVPIKIPLLQAAESLLNKYENHQRTRVTGYLMPYMSNQKLNSYLKEIANLCRVSKNLTFHMARHTFATTVTLSNGVPIETVSKLLGHTKIATTQIYARVIEEKISEDMQNLSKQILK
nr:site-specific integrase [Allomuricauda sp.]